MSYMSPTLPRSPRKSYVSRPTFHPHFPYGQPDMDEYADEDLEKGKEDFEPMERMPDCPPKLELSAMQLDGQDSRSLHESITGIEMNTHDDFDRSSFGMQNDTSPSQHPPDSMRIPTELAKRSSMQSDTCRKHKRRNTVVYHGQIHRSTGLPVNQRITGMGHGCHVFAV